jgi:ATP synthase subunit 8
MAQLNYYTYLSQATSLIIIYIFYYYINKQIIIPRIVEKIKIKNYINKKSINFINTPHPKGCGVTGQENKFKYFIKII